jgi:hypothetical protein
VSRKFGQTKFAGLFFKDDFSKYRLDSVGSLYGRRYDVKGVNSRVTYGLLVNGTIGNASGLKKTWQVGGYLQSGKDRDGKNLDAYHYTASLLLQQGNFSFGPGFDYLSGGDGQRFDPLYGTPHKHWGYMDYYYVGTGSPVGGLQNAYFKTKYQANRYFITLDAHYFRLAEDMMDASKGTSINKNLGYEFDLVGSYNLNKFTTLEAGYALMLANNSTEFVKRGTTGQAKHTPQWAYLMINIRPDFFFTKPVAVKQ